MDSSTTLSNLDIEFVARLVEASSGNVLDGKAYLIDARLSMLAERMNYNSPSQLVEALRQGSPSLECAVAESLCVHETYFFRDPHYFEALAEVVLPRLLEARKDRHLRIWCAGCAGGHEAYAIAMILSEVLGASFESWRIELLGTDLSAGMIQRARQGEFSRVDVQRGLTEERRNRYFRKSDDRWVLDPSIRRRVEFETLNLLGPWNAFSRCDVVLLRNVLVYMRPTVRREILQRAARLLAPDGYLVLGSTEAPEPNMTFLERVDIRSARFYRLTAG